MRTPVDLARLLGADARRNPRMQAIWERLLVEDAGLPDATLLPAAEGRALQARLTRRWNVELPEVAAVETLTIPGPFGAVDVAAELTTPKGARPGCILFAHGGGWAFGDLDSHRRLTRALAIESGLRVLSVDYRRSPEDPYPAGLEDYAAAWKWLVAAGAREPALAGVKAVAGDSAGANLALALALRQIEAGQIGPDAALLFYGVFAADLDSPSYLRFAEGFGLTRARMARFWKWYAPDLNEGERAADPQLQPLRASEGMLARLPRLYFNAAGLDPLLCDTLALLRRLDDAGVEYSFDLFEGVHHGFMQMTGFLEDAREATRRAGRFLREGEAARNAAE